MGDIGTKIYLWGAYPRGEDALSARQQVQEICEEFGKIASIKIPVTDGGIPRGFAFVTYETAEEAAKAIDGLDQRQHNNHRLECNLARPKIEY